MTTPHFNAEQLGADLAARLAACTVAQGAETDLGLVVHRGRRKVEPEDMPCAVLVEGGDEPREELPQSTQCTMKREFVLQAYVPCDPLNPNVAGHAALRDLKRAVFRTGGVADMTLGRKVQRLAYHSADIAPRADGTGYVLAAIHITAQSYEDLANP